MSMAMGSFRWQGLNPAGFSDSRSDPTIFPIRRVRACLNCVPFLARRLARPHILGTNAAHR